MNYWEEIKIGFDGFVRLCPYALMLFPAFFLILLMWFVFTQEEQ